MSLSWVKGCESESGGDPVRAPQAWMAWLRGIEAVLQGPRIARLGRLFKCISPCLCRRKKNGELTTAHIS